MRRHPLALFFTLAFALPWFVWGTALAEQAGWIGWHIPGALAFWIGLPVASFGTAAITGGKRAVADLLLRMVRVRVGVRWYLAALLTTPVLAGVTALTAFATGLPLDPEAASWLGVLGAFAFNAWMWLLTEETAWRGFALPRMLPRFGEIGANLLLGAIWAVWHLPLFWVDGSFQSRLPFVAFAVSTIATSMLIGSVFRGARGSVLLAALFHASADVTIGFSGVMSSHPVLLWVFVALQTLAAVAVAVIVSRRSSPKLRPARPRR
jgi:membrane protease YdiL (CAAX protease family)